MNATAANNNQQELKNVNNSQALPSRLRFATISQDKVSLKREG